MTAPGVGLAGRASPRSRRGRILWVAVLVAVVYGAALVLAGVVLPFYSVESASSTGETSSGTATLVAENGVSAAVVLCIPLAIAVGTGLLVLRRPSRRRILAARVLVVLLAVFTLLALASIGILVLPVTLALGLAVAVAPGTGGPADERGR